MSDRATVTFAERLKSALTWHYVGFAILLVLTITLAARLTLDWIATNGHSTSELAGKQVELRAMDLQTAPLRGLDQRVSLSRQQIEDFYAKRIPPNYSSISERIGTLEVKSGARLSRLIYSQGPQEEGLTEISLDAGVSGSYPEIMHLINSIERDPTFFVIRAMQFAGQQGGQVNLRLRVSTWLRPADVPSGLPSTTPGLAPETAEPENPPAVGANGKEGE